MGKPMDYGAYAPTYATARWAVPWVLEPLAERVRALRRGARVLEIGCGTGNYLEALGRGVPGRRYFGFDRSVGMLAQALPRGATHGSYAAGDADAGFPLAGAAFALAFVVDVLHHLADYRVFFGEVARVLEPGGSLVAVTDSDENMAKRSLTRFFPEILPVERERYPSLAELDVHAGAAGLERTATILAEGLIDLDDAFVAKLAAKCSSAMRLIPDAAHRRGMERVSDARRRGERWLSSYSVLVFERR
jgi:SAM-dependent methyltransferase